MSTYYTVCRGDCLSSIASQFGFSDYQTIYFHPENAAFRQKRPNPNVIYEGDVVFIPDPAVQELSCATDVAHRFVLKRSKVFVRLCFRDDAENPYTNIKYRLRIGSRTYNGLTDGSGMVEREIAADASEGEVTIFPQWSDPPGQGFTFALRLGDLDPIEETSGIDARLKNLGFGPADSLEETLSEEDRQEALKAFQDKFGLEVSGEADAATRAKLLQFHDNE